MKSGFTLIELMILVIILGVLAMTLYPSYNSVQTRAMEAKVRANMSVVQIAVEEFATVTEGIYPRDFLTTVFSANPAIVNFTTVAGITGGVWPIASTPADPVLLPINFRNPVNRTVAWAFSSVAVSFTSPPGAIIAPGCGAACDQGSVWYGSSDVYDWAASIQTATKYRIYGYGVNSLLPMPLTEKQ